MLLCDPTGYAPGLPDIRPPRMKRRCEYPMSLAFLRPPVAVDQPPRRPVLPPWERKKATREPVEASPGRGITLEGVVGGAG